jgi:hypothetical protein
MLNCDIPFLLSVEGKQSNAVLFIGETKLLFFFTIKSSISIF